MKRSYSNKARDRSDQSEDGTEIEDDDYLEHVAQHAILLVRLPGGGKRKTHDWLSKSKDTMHVSWKAKVNSHTAYIWYVFADTVTLKVQGDIVRYAACTFVFRYTESFWNCLKSLIQSLRTTIP